MNLDVRCDYCGKPGPLTGGLCPRCLADLNTELEEQRQKDRPR